MRVLFKIRGREKEGDMRFFQYFFYKGRILFYALLSLLFAALLLFFSELVRGEGAFFPSLSPSPL